MKKYIIILIAFAWSLNAKAQCRNVNPDFCPGNYFQNGDFSTTTGNPGSTNNINLATGWSAIWTQASALADLFCGDAGLNTNPPLPNNGVYAGMWVINSSSPINGSNKPHEREGMYNRLNTPIARSTGSYTFNFDISNGRKQTDYATIGIYGVYNPSGQLGSKTNLHVPSNVNLFNNVTGAQVVYLGSVTTPQPFSSDWTNQSVTFNSNILPANGITHILITSDDSQKSTWCKIYVNFDNFCLALTSPPEPACCQTPLDIFNVQNTPDILPIQSQNMGGTDFSTATETFEIHKNSTIPITELRVVVTDIQYEYNYESCGECVDNPALWGSLMSQSTIGEKGLMLTPQDYGLGNPNYVAENATVREMIWSNPNGAMLKSGDKFDVTYVLPPVSDIPCCVTSVKICTTISWKDANCNVCETPTCSTIKLNGEASSTSSGTTNPAPACDCGRQLSETIEVTHKQSGMGFPGSGNSNVGCGGSFTEKYDKSFSDRYSFRAPFYSCSEKGCAAEYKWEIVENGRVIESGTSSRINDYHFNSKGTYTVRFTPICGGKECKPCEIGVRLR